MLTDVSTQYSTATLSLAQARRVALAAQGMNRVRPETVSTRHLNATMQRMGVLQIDSVNVFARSHYMPLFSRLGHYDQALLEKLLFAARGPYTEYWGHMASFIPTCDWSLFRFRMDDMRARYGSDPAGWFRQNQKVVEWVRAELRERGPLRPAEIEHDTSEKKRGPWWDWNDVKNALEHLWYFGEVAIAGRQGFQRRYALVEDVIPAEVLSAPVARSDAYRELVSRAARAHGVATAADIADYWRLGNSREVNGAINELVDAGELLPVTVQGWNGPRDSAWMPTGTRIPRHVRCTAILTPFDPVVWFRERAERLFDFDYRIEIYTPAHKRRFGYYSLPVLIDERIVARIDLKADRAGSTLLVQSAWWEPDAPPDAARRIAEELHSAALWQGLDRISISSWGDATASLSTAMPDALRHDSTRQQGTR